MDLRQMRCFVALAETLHFGHAAARMNMTQPPFSRQIANLERDLGARLVERTSRQVRLTAAGDQFLADARRLIEGTERARRDARMVAEGRRGELRFGFMMHAAHSVVPRIVRAYVQARPDVRLTLNEVTPAEIDRRLLDGRLDAAVTFAAPILPQLESVPIFSDRLCLALPRGHALAGTGPVGPAELAQEALIAAPADVTPVLRETIAGYFAKADITPPIRFEPKLQNTILRLVAEGLGIALVPASICDGTVPDILAQELQSPPVLQVVLRHRSDNRNPALPLLLEILLSRIWS